MKRFFYLLLLSLFVVSCGPNKPNDKVLKVDVVHNGFKPGPTPKDPVQAVYDTSVMIHPTWGQAKSIAAKRDDNTLWTIIGFGLLAVTVFLFVAKALELSWFPKVDEKFLGAFFFAMIVFTALAFTWRSMEIKWRNYKLVPKSQFDKAIRETGSSQPVWDSLINGCHIVGGPDHCFKKKK